MELGLNGKVAVITGGSEGLARVLPSVCVKRVRK